MKWKKKSTPQYGDLKVASVFLWLPTCFGNEYRWLCRAEIQYEYCKGVRTSGRSKLPNRVDAWVALGWADKPIQETHADRDRRIATTPIANPSNQSV